MTTWVNETSTRPARDLWSAMMRGFRGRCPECGEGGLFRSFLKTNDACAVCGLEFHHHRADDLPAYLVIVIVGHVIVPFVLAVETNYAPSYLFHALVWLPLTLGMSLGLLQPVKGSIVGLQWAFRMHGFDQNAAIDPMEAGLVDKNLRTGTR